MQSSEHKKLQLMWRHLTRIKAEGFREVGAEDIWNTEQEGGMDGSMQLALMTWRMYEHSCGGESSKNRANCKTYAESGAEF